MSGARCSLHWKWRFVCLRWWNVLASACLRRGAPRSGLDSWPSSIFKLFCLLSARCLMIPTFSPVPLPTVAVGALQGLPGCVCFSWGGVCLQCGIPASSCRGNLERLPWFIRAQCVSGMPLLRSWEWWKGSCLMQLFTETLSRNSPKQGKKNSSLSWLHWRVSKGALSWVFLA